MSYLVWRPKKVVNGSKWTHFWIISRHRVFNLTRQVKFCHQIIETKFEMCRFHATKMPCKLLQNDWQNDQSISPKRLQYNICVISFYVISRFTLRGNPFKAVWGIRKAYTKTLMLQITFLSFNYFNSFWKLHGMEHKEY